jgi:hypothetical protein
MCHSTRPEGAAQKPAQDLCDIEKINRKLLKLYPDDFSLQLNLKQLSQLQKEHDAAMVQAARTEERGAWMKALKDTIEIGLPDQEHVLDRVRLFVKEWGESPRQHK